MSAPEPYQPEPGAIICLAGDVPEDGWEVRALWLDAPWHPVASWLPGAIVEARPIPKPPLMVPMDHDDARALADFATGRMTHPAVFKAAEAARAALAAEAES